MITKPNFTNTSWKSLIRPLAALALAFTLPAGAETQPAAIPISEIGARATANYQGDALGLTATPDGARLRCGFQKLEGHATPEGLWLESTRLGGAGRLRLVAVTVGRGGSRALPCALTEAASSVRSAMSIVTVPQSDQAPLGAPCTHRAASLFDLPLLTELETTFSDLPFSTLNPQPSTVLATTGKVSVNDKLVWLTRPGLTEEYSASVDGVRQDFIIESPPLNPQPSTLNHSAGDLRVELALSGAQAEAAAGGAKLQLVGSGRVLAYSRLRVEDATGRELTARLEVLSPDRLAVSVADANATYPVRIDPTFSDADWVGVGSGVNGRVSALAVSGTDLYAGGGFTTAGGVSANYVAKWNGSAWSALGSGMNGGVAALAVSGTNLYAGGGFTTAGGVLVTNIAKWDGSAWSALGSGLDNLVIALAVSGTDLYAGGYFTNAGGVIVNGIAKWNGSAWSALGSGISGTHYYYWAAGVRALAVSGTDLYVGGLFMNAGGIAVNGLAKWNGSAWSALGSGVYFDNDQYFYPPVSALAVSGTDLYAGGYFTGAGGVPALNIAKWNGSAWSALGSGVAFHYPQYPDTAVDALAVSGSNLYVGGRFTTAGGVRATNIAKWNGSAWSALGSGTGDPSVDGWVLALAADGAGQLFAGGSFSWAGTNVSPYIAEAVLVPTAPTILSPPLPQTAAVGCTVEFQVEIGGPGRLAYQWFFNATNFVSGGTNAILQLTDVQLSQSGVYSVVVSDAYGSVTSPPAMLTVTVPPVIAVPPTNQKIWIGSTAHFSVLAGGALPLVYQWFFGADAILWATNSTLQLTNVQPLQAGGYAVVVTNVYGAVTSAPAMLGVFPPGTVVATSEESLRAALGARRTVTFACDGTITLSNTIVVATNTVLDGSGSQITISGNNACRVFSVNSNVNLTLVNLTIANGLSMNGYGGGIYNEGTVMLDLCTLTGNSATGGDAAGGAIFNQGTLTVNRTTLCGNAASGGIGADSYTGAGGSGGEAKGAAICNLGTMVAKRSLFASNTIVGGTGGNGGNGGTEMQFYPAAWYGGMGGPGGDAYGGALFVGGPSSLVNCTLTGNQAHGGPGGTGGNGVVFYDSGADRYFWFRPGWSGGFGGAACGAVYDATGVLRLTNCTIAFNSSDGGHGGIGGMGTSSGSPGGLGVAVGGLQTTNGVSVNSLLAGNSPTDGTGSIADAGHNLGSDGSCAFTNIGSMNNTDPRLGPLANNGGPTLTMALLPGSPAIDAGDTSLAPATDQRGFSRPAGLAADIGAFEYGSVMSPIAVSRSGATGLSIVAIGNAGRSCRLLSSPDLLNWVPLATNQFGSDGTILFNVNSPPGSACRFYRLVMP